MKIIYESGVLVVGDNTDQRQKQGQFDRIYWNGNEANPELFVIETKGGSSSLGSREVKYVSNSQGLRVQQGTTQYRDDIIAEMRRALNDDKVPSKNANDIEHFLEMTDKITNTGKGKINYLLIRQEIEFNGDKLIDPIVKQFN